MKNVTIWDFVETIHNLNGVLIDVRRGYYGAVAFIATSDMRTFYCLITDLKNCVYTGKVNEPYKG